MTWSERKIRRYARRHPNIQPGAWLLDLGMPTPRAVLIKQAYELQRALASLRPTEEPENHQ